MRARPRPDSRRRWAHDRRSAMSEDTAETVAASDAVIERPEPESGSEDDRRSPWQDGAPDGGSGRARRRARRTRAKGTWRSLSRSGQWTKPPGCVERSRRGLRLPAVPVVAAVRPDRRRRARPHNANSTEDAVEGGGLPGAVTNAVGDAARSAHSNSWWLFAVGVSLLLWAGFTGAKAVVLIHSLVWDEPPPKPKPLQASLAFTGMHVCVHGRNRAHLVVP